MKELLPFDLKENFYIRVYFNIEKGFEIAGIKRAYLDFNRTLVIKDKDRNKRNILRNDAELYIKSELLRIISLEIENQKLFDQIHRELCMSLINKWNELSIGQAQKWINMTLKYWLLFGEKRIQNIEKNAIFFHIPIDSFIQKEMFNEKYPNPWSRIENYDEYLQYQLTHREREEKYPPIICEFHIFNQTRKTKN